MLVAFAIDSKEEGGINDAGVVIGATDSNSVPMVNGFFDVIDWFLVQLVPVTFGSA